MFCVTGFVARIVSFMCSEIVITLSKLQDITLLSTLCYCDVTSIDSASFSSMTSLEFKPRATRSLIENLSLSLINVNAWTFFVSPYSYS